MKKFTAIAAACLLSSAACAAPVLTFFEAAGPDAASITAERDDFRAAIGGGNVAGPGPGLFGGVRREINWDAVPAAFSDSNALPANFFNVNSPRGVVFETPGTGFLVSANAGGSTPVLFGFPNDFAVFSPQKLFTAVNSNITDVHFFVAGTTDEATTTAFGAIFTDVEIAGDTRLEFFDANDVLIGSRDVPESGNQGLSFLGAEVSGGTIGRVRIISGRNTIVSNGVLGNQFDDVVVMDDFIYAEPVLLQAVPEPAALTLATLALFGLGATRRRRG